MAQRTPAHVTCCEGKPQPEACVTCILWTLSKMQKGSMTRKCWTGIQTSSPVFLYPSHLYNRKGSHWHALRLKHSINSNCGIPGWGAKNSLLKSVLPALLHGRIIKNTFDMLGTMQGFVSNACFAQTKEHVQFCPFSRWANQGSGIHFLSCRGGTEASPK